MTLSAATERLKIWLVDGLLLCSILLLAIFMGIALYVRLNALANPAALLPAEETEGFLVLNREDYQATTAPEMQSEFLSSVLGHPTSELTWLGRDLAFASINGNGVTFLQINSASGAQTFLDSLKTEGEEYTGDVPQCYVSLPTCFLFLDDFLILSTAPETLALFHEAQFSAPKLADSPDYQNVRGRLPSLTSGFAYINLQKARQEFIRYADSLGIEEPGFLESILQIFPAFGASLHMESTGWYVESFTAVDKAILNNEAYYHPTEKYEQTLLPWTQPFAVEWGGQNAAAQLTRLREIFSQLNSTAELVFESSLESWLTEIFGSTTLTEPDFLVNRILPLLDEEYYLGYTPGDSFLALVQLEDTDEVQKAAQLKDLFAQNYRSKKTKTDAKGETRAELLPLTTSLLQHGDAEYYRFDADGQTIATVAFLEHLAIITSSEEILFATLDRQVDPKGLRAEASAYGLSNRQSGRSLQDFMVLLPGSDEIFILNSAFLPKESILNALLSTFTHSASTRKLFDDGVYTRTSLLRSQTQ